MQKIEQEYPGSSADFFTEPVNLEDFYAFSAQINAVNGNSLDATVTLQVSNDQRQWTDVTGTSKALAGSEDLQIYDVVQSAVTYVRIKVVIASGDADIDVDWALKSF